MPSQALFFAELLLANFPSLRLRTVVGPALLRRVCPRYDLHNGSIRNVTAAVEEKTVVVDKRELVDVSQDSR